MECPGKNEWPELVGQNGYKAAEIIEKENRNVTAIVILDGTIVTQEFTCSRVYVWVDRQRVVVRPPKVG
ncbi:Inhibitor of trypsin and hageman factor [Bienertia sinuspersici]